jgi:ribosomal protein S19
LSRDNDEFALPTSIEACKQQIGISEKAKKAFLKKMCIIPSHVGYTQLCIHNGKTEKL